MESCIYTALVYEGKYLYRENYGKLCTENYSKIGV